MPDEDRRGGSALARVDLPTSLEGQLIDALTETGRMKTALLDVTFDFSQAPDTAVRLMLRKASMAKSTEPDKAIAELASFGAAVTTTFNKNIGSIFGGDVLRPRGTLGGWVRRVGRQ